MTNAIGGLYRRSDARGDQKLRLHARRPGWHAICKPRL